MRSILISLTLVSIFSCDSQTSVITEKEFAKVYLDSLKKRYPDIKFELNSDLSITSKKEDLDYKHYIENAYIAYKAEPDSIKNVISRYVASSADLYVVKEKINTLNIVPVVKPIEYLDEINSLK